MPLPDVTPVINDGALGILAASTSNVHVKIGVSSLGTVNTLYTFSDPKTLQTTLGYGPVVEAAAHTLAVSGNQVIIVPVNASVPGTTGATAYVRVAASTFTVTSTTAPLDGFAIVLTIITGAVSLAAALASFTYSLDGGTTTSATIAIPVSGIYAIPNTGLSFTFVTGTFTAGDVATIACVAPGYNATDLNAAFTALFASPLTWGFVHVVGEAASGAAQAAIASAVDVQMTAAATAFRYAFAIVEANDTDAALTTAFASFVSLRVMVCAGRCTLTSQVSGRAYARNAAWPIAARLAKAPIAEDPGRVLSGPLPGVTAIARDEQATPALDALKFTTLRTILAYAGFYVTNGRTMAAVGSDFTFIQNRRVMDAACNIARARLVKTALNNSFRVDPITGFIFENDARTLESDLDSILRAGLPVPQAASDVTVVTNRTTNILSTSKLTVAVRVLPLSYGKYITLDIGFTNPALAPKSPAT